MRNIKYSPLDDMTLLLYRPESYQKDIETAEYYPVGECMGNSS